MITQKRIPLFGAYNTRFEAASGDPQTSGIVGIGIVGKMIVGHLNAASDKDQRFINCYPVTVRNPGMDQVTAYLVKRPGFQVNATVQAGSVGNDIHIWVGNSAKVISAFGAANSIIYDGASVQGTITGVCSGITETILSGTANLAITSTDSTGWFQAAGGSLTKITDSDFPGNASRTLAGTFAHLDGFAFVMDTTGRIYNSDLNSLSAWTANSYASANLNTDGGVGCVKYRNHIIAFGTQSYEVWYNAGNPAGSPLSRRDEACRTIGLVNKDSVVSLEDLLAFVGTTDVGGVALYVMDGFMPQRVSTPEIDAQMVLTGVTNIKASAMKMLGRTFVYVSCGSSTYVYCVEEKLWHEVRSSTALWHKMSGITSGSTVATYAISTTSTGGKTYIVNPTNFGFSDDGYVYTASFQTSLLDFGDTRKKTIEELVLVGDVTAGSTINISFSTDDYATFGGTRTLDLSTIRPRFTKGPTFRRISIAGSHTANTPMRLQALDLRLRMHNT